ncbi:MAG TPA: thioredoxin domain-containing protein [Deltaproteobacteria bacterium]|nr:thioredoxin domain-containing protein [Deltaproteobacteria bacterium]HOI07364.1 thioredoxin domain-containing protein [Deltaproteobacteria bacterium]
MGTEKKNRLGSSMSPYLLQHAENPVAWLPWGEEAFGLARKEDKPVFLSIGYSSCHWCHVMAHECFEDAEVAALMNEAFISVKVDREELPHVDHIYMRIAQMMTGSGGWPLTIIMTPEKEPFFAATFLPKHTRGGLMGMMELVPLIREAWKKDRTEVEAVARRVARAASEPVPRQGSEAPLPDLVQGAFSSLFRMFQPDTGGFSQAPKFPSAHHLMFLLRYHRSTGSAQALDMVEKTLDDMSRGGIYDHLGHGFHRYATDSLWRIPHFEKMLYDQALLAMAYTEAFLVTGRPLYRRIATGTLDFVLRDMRSEDGLFYSALDADTGREEGGYYLWTVPELQSVLGAEDYRLFSEVFAVELGGNFPEGRLHGKNILFMKESVSEIARRKGIPGDVLQEAVDRMSGTLLVARGKRPAPYRDEKALTDWNGLMIAALAKAGAAFDEPRYTEAACRATDFILGNVHDSGGRLLHAYREGRADHRALLDDYAFLAWGLIEIYQAAFRPAYLEKALALTHESLRLFWDRKEGGFFLTPDDMDVVITRPKELFDNALPSGNSVSLTNLIRLWRLTGESALEEKASQTARAASGPLSTVPAAASFLMAGLLLVSGPSREVVIAGRPGSEDTLSLLKAARSLFRPEGVIALNTGDDEGPALARDKRPFEGRAAAYVCQGSTCLPPVTDPGELLEVLSRKA